MEKLLKMKRRNTVFVDKETTGLRLKSADGRPRLGYMCKCLKCGGDDCIGR